MKKKGTFDIAIEELRTLALEYGLYARTPGRSPGCARAAKELRAAIAVLKQAEKIPAWVLSEFLADPKNKNDAVFEISRAILRARKIAERSKT